MIIHKSRIIFCTQAICMRMLLMKLFLNSPHCLKRDFLQVNKNHHCTLFQYTFYFHAHQNLCGLLFTLKVEKHTCLKKIASVRLQIFTFFLLPKGCLSNSDFFSYTCIQHFLVGTTVERFVPTQLGLAVLSSSISPDEGLVVFSELRKARQCFVLENELHIIYQVQQTFYVACCGVIQVIDYCV